MNPSSPQLEEVRTSRSVRKAVSTSKVDDIAIMYVAYIYYIIVRREVY